MARPEILAALTTPFTADGEVDHEAFGANLRRLSKSVDGVFVAGTTGEFPALSLAEHAELTRACLEAFGPERSVVHVGAASTSRAVKLAKTAAHMGVTRFAALTPYYLPASTDGVRRHWSAISDACGGELYGYIFPDVAVTDLPPESLPDVLDSGIVGVKVSGSASARVPAYLDHAPEGFKLWSGNDADVPAVMAAGGTGTVSGVSGACPEPWARLREAMAAGDEHEIRAAQEIITSVVAVLGPSITRLKAALDLQDLPGGSCRMVIDPPSPHIHQGIAAVVDLATSNQRSSQ